MKNAIVLTVALVVGLSACSPQLEQARVSPTSKPPPTATPYPTYTVVPTYTTALTATPVPPPTMMTHTVRAGETLGTIAGAYGTTVEAIANANAIADINLLSVGQVLLIPEGSYPAPPAGGYPAPLTAVPVLPTSPNDAAGKIVISGACSQFDAPGNDNENLNQEYVCLENIGGSPIDMTNWRIVDEYGHTYTFPAFALSVGARVLLHSGCGGNTATDLYWCREGAAVWNNDGDTVHVYDGAGMLRDQHKYSR